MFRAMLAIATLVALPQAICADVKSDLAAAIDQRADESWTIARQIWEWAEPGYQETQSAKLLADTLERAGFRVETEDYDCVVLDLGLPRVDGLTLLAQWRRAGRTMPVLVLTARGSWHEKVIGIDAGADDYVAKPFHVEEVIARVRALIRRAAGHADVVGGDRKALVALVMACHGLAQRRHAARRRILVRALLDRARRRVENRVGPAEIGKALAKVDRIMLRGEPGHAFEHAGLHLLVKRVHCGSLRMVAISPGS